MGNHPGDARALGPRANMKPNSPDRLIEVFNSVQGAAFFQRLLHEWRNTGAQVISHQAVSEADYRTSRGPLGRLVLRWRMYAGYAWLCWRRGRKSRGLSPIRVVTTNPFFAPALVARATSGHGPTVNLLFDLFPEALIQAGTIGADSWVARRCAAITRFSLRKCEATVFLGEHLRTYAEATYGRARIGVVIPVGADGAAFRQSPPGLLPAGIHPRILYSGQMGSMHDTATVASTWPDLRNLRIKWVFHASGSGYVRLRQSVGEDDAVTWGGALGDAEWQRTMKEAQVALVTMTPGAEKVVMPSKTYSAMVAGQALLAICPRSSDLADLVIRHDCGWVVEPGDCVGLRRVVEIIATDPAGLLLRRRNAFEAGHRYYDMTPIAAQWEQLFARLASPSGETVTEADNPRAA